MGTTMTTTETTTPKSNVAHRIVFFAIGCGYAWDGALCRNVGQAVVEWCWVTGIVSVLILDVFLSESVKSESAPVETHERRE